MNTIYRIALFFVIVGAINWGLIGLFNYNLVNAIFGVGTFLSHLIYSIVGLAGLLSIPMLVKRFEDDRLDEPATFTNREPAMEAGEEFEFSETNRRRKDKSDKDDDTIV